MLETAESKRLRVCGLMIGGAFSISAPHVWSSLFAQSLSLLMIATTTKAATTRTMMFDLMQSEANGEKRGPDEALELSSSQPALLLLGGSLDNSVFECSFKFPASIVFA